MFRRYSTKFSTIDFFLLVATLYQSHLAFEQMQRWKLWILHFVSFSPCFQTKHLVSKFFPSQNCCRTVDEAIKRANDTRYGLAAGIVTNNLNVANTVSRSIRAGIIWINCYFAFDLDCPYGGYKMSGFGRDMGMDALDKYLHVKSVVTPIYDSPWL